MPVFRDFSSTNRTAENGLPTVNTVNELAFLSSPHHYDDFSDLPFEIRSEAINLLRQYYS